jgi:polysaccharide biosynthesis transport protein
MEPIKEIDLRDLLAGFRRRRKLMLVVAGPIALISVLLALFLPPVYRSQAIILIEQQEIPSDLVRSTVTSFADQRIQVISQRVMTSTNLLDIVERFALYEDMRARQPRELVLEQMREDIRRQMISAEVVDPRSGRPTEATIAFSLSYDSPNPALAQRVTNELVSLFLNENIKSRNEAAQDTASFLTTEAEVLRTRVGELEKELADFKGQNINNRPELDRVIRENLNRVELEAVETERRIRTAQQQKIYLEAELAQLEPYRALEVTGAMSASERLRAVEAELAAAEASYGSRHPDVVRLQKQAEALRTEVDPGSARKVDARSALQQLGDRYDPTHPDVIKARKRVQALETRLDTLPTDSAPVPNNPAYISLKAQLDSVTNEMTSLENQRVLLRGRIEGMSADLLRMPEVEAQFRAIEREYDNAFRKYQEISAKQMEARLSQNLESERKGEKFTLIEPPSIPEEPAEPNRMAILVIGLLLAMGSALGGAILVEAMDDKVRGRRGVQALLTAPPLASIPIFSDPAMASVGSTGFGRLATLVGVIGLAVLTATHVWYKPLDVLWFVVLRKLGL